jgi:hypothetical protein
MEVSAPTSPVLAACGQEQDQGGGGCIGPADLSAQLQSVADAVRMDHLLFVEVNEAMVLSHNHVFLSVEVLAGFETTNAASLVCESAPRRS